MGRGYDVEVKVQAQAMYREGTPRRDIADTMGIPLSTIRLWTVDIVSAPLSFVKCVVCGKKKRTMNIQQQYCSSSCKSRANYQRRRQRLPGPTTRNCEHCGKVYPPRHGNAIKYCTAECRRKASIERRVKRRDQSHEIAEKEQFYHCLETLFQAKRDTHDTKIDSHRYRTELDTIAGYFDTHKSALSQSDFNRVQDIFQSVS